MRIAQMDFLSNVVFDNIFSDMAMRDRIMDSMGQISNAYQNLSREIQTQVQRVSAVQTDANQAKTTLDLKRGELQQIRAAAFERFSGSRDMELEGTVEGIDSAPPAYTP